MLKRNSEALTSYDEILALEGDNEDQQKLLTETKEGDGDDLEQGDSELPRSDSFSVDGQRGSPQWSLFQRKCFS